MTRGLIGHIRDYQVLTCGDQVTIAHRGLPLYSGRVENLGEFIENRKDHLRLGWGQLPDFEVMYLYDRRDCFGYAINVTAPDLSEWGYAPFETPQQGHPNQEDRGEL